MSTIAVSPSITLRRPVTRVARPAAVRLTRRGRFVVTLLFLAVLLAAFTAFGARSAATGEAGDPVPTRTVTVGEGDTLWEIAGSVAGPGEVRSMVHRIQELNALSGSALDVGQEIAVPVR
jgi:hypothetical protein